VFVFTFLNNIAEKIVLSGSLEIDLKPMMFHFVRLSKFDQKMADNAKHKRTKTFNFLKYDNFFLAELTKIMSFSYLCQKTIIFCSKTARNNQIHQKIFFPL
jgi:hypothetical protein